MKAWDRYRSDRRTRAAREQAVKDAGTCARCGIYKAQSTIRRHAEEHGDDLTHASSWLPLCGYCHGEVEAERRALRRAGFHLVAKG